MDSKPDDRPPGTIASPESDAAPRELNRLDILRGLRIATWEASFATVWASLTTGAFLTGYALWLGANNVAMGVLTAIPTFAGLIQLVSSYITERRTERKRLTAWFSVIGRTLWLPILLLPILLPSAPKLLPFLLLFTLSYVFLNVPIPAYMSWMSDLVPADHRGRYFGRRNMIAGIVGMVIGLPAAWFLDFATKRHHWEAFGFGTLFACGVVGGLLSFACLLRQPEPPKRLAPKAETDGGLATILAYYRAPFADLNFRRLMTFNAILGMGQFFAAPFFTVYALQTLKLNYIWLQVFSTLTSISSLASMPLWGYLADKFGNKPLLAIGVCGVFTLPITWIFTTPDNPLLTLLLIAEVNLLGGMAWAGVGLTQFNLLISLSPSEKTPIYVATMAAVTGLTGGLAPLAGSAVMGLLEGWHGSLFGHTLSNFHVTFFIAAALRLLSLGWLHPVVDARAASARDVLQQLGRANPRAWRHIRQLQRGGDEETKLRATEALAESRTQLAVSELQAALNDPSHAVREEAARALGEIGDPAAVDALLSALSDPAAGLIQEAARALGRIGDRRANPVLIAILRGEADLSSKNDWLAAARTLGELGGPDAVNALLQVLQMTFAEETEDSEFTETLIRALGQAGDRHATPALIACLEQEEIPRPRQLALIRALGELGDKAAVGALRTALAAHAADPILLPPLADALARLDDREAALPLLDALALQESPVARKQVANAIGGLLGEGEEVYSLLSTEDFARDTAVSRLALEMQKRVRGDAAATQRLAEALNAYIGGNYRACIEALAQASHRLPAALGGTERNALCRRVLVHLASGAGEGPPVEAALLALCALNALFEES